jgi:hypothetical protein
MDIVDAVLYINLAQRVDRNKTILSNLHMYEFDMDRYRVLRVDVDLHTLWPRVISKHWNMPYRWILTML